MINKPLAILTLIIRNPQIQIVYPEVCRWIGNEKVVIFTAAVVCLMKFIRRELTVPAILALKVVPIIMRQFLKPMKARMRLARIGNRH